MMSDQYHVTVGKEKKEDRQFNIFFTRNGSKDCNLTTLAVFLEKRSGKKKNVHNTVYDHERLISIWLWL